MKTTARPIDTTTDPTECPASNSPGKHIAFLILQLDQQIRSHLEARVAEFDLTGPQGRLLQMLERPMSMNEVAELLHCDPSNVTGIVDRLEARGFVERQPLATDRRVKQLVLTREGERARHCLGDLFETIPGLSDLSDRELNDLATALERVVTPGSGC